MSKKDAGGKFSVGAYTFNEEIVRKDLAYMIVLHEYPLSMVKHFGFHRFLGSLQPLFKMVSRNIVKNDIVKIYEFEKTKTMRILGKNTSRIAITIDMWATSSQKKGFIYVSCPHTAEVFCEVLVDYLIDWFIDRKLSRLTLDNYTTNDDMVNLILNKLDNRSLWLEGDGMYVIGDGIDNIRSSVAFWVATPKRCEKFEKTTRLLKVSSSKKLVLDCNTRWNYTYKMLQLVICYKDVFTRLKQREPLYKSAPKEEEWEIAREICDKFKVFNNVTKLFSGTGYPTVNLYFSKFCEIKLSLKQWLCCGEPIVERMAMRMLDKFEKYWFQINGIMGVAIILDPRYKLRLLHYYFPLLYTNDEDAKKEIERNQGICYNLLNEYALKSKISEVGAFCQSSASSFTSPDETDPMRNYDNTGGRFISPRRSRLHHDTLEVLMCSQDWLWTETKEIGATPSKYCAYHDDVDDEMNETFGRLLPSIAGHAVVRHHLVCCPLHVLMASSPSSLWITDVPIATWEVAHRLIICGTDHSDLKFPPQSQSMYCVKLVSCGTDHILRSSPVKYFT
ncbi:hypothetical protein ACS0TY_027581 [Phlomoides rotata]